MAQPRRGHREEDLAGEARAACRAKVACRLRRRLWLERAVFLAIVVLFLLFHLGVLPGGRRVCLVTLDGEPVAVVATRADAERMLNEIKSAARGASASGLEPNEVQFAQKVKLESVPAAHNPVQSDSEAIKALRSHLRMVVPAAAILANGEVVIALPDQGEAVRTLSLLLSEFAPPGPNLTVFFREKVKVEMRDVPPDKLFHSADEAVSRIAEAASSKVEHAVKPGESAWKIAQDYQVTLARLSQANPGVNLNSLRAGLKLKIPGPLPPLTVVARKEIQGQPGEGVSLPARKVRVTYENGVEVRREVIGRRAPARQVASPPAAAAAPVAGGDPGASSRPASREPSQHGNEIPR
jgi:LysM repeat protein